MFITTSGCSKTDTLPVAPDEAITLRFGSSTSISTELLTTVISDLLSSGLKQTMSRLVLLDSHAHSARNCQSHLVGVFGTQFRSQSRRKKLHMFGSLRIFCRSVISFCNVQFEKNWFDCHGEYPKHGRTQ